MSIYDDTEKDDMDEAPWIPICGLLVVGGIALILGASRLAEWLAQ